MDLNISLRLLETDKLVGNKEKAESSTHSTGLGLMLSEVEASKSIQTRVQKARDIRNKKYEGTKFISNFLS